jgi:hypothetical protein
MDTVAEYRKHAASCAQMARTTVDRQSREIWKRMSERWLVCAKLEDERAAAARLHARNQKRHRGALQHSWSS